MSKKLAQVSLPNVGEKVFEPGNQSDFDSGRTSIENEKFEVQSDMTEEDQKFLDEWNRKKDYAHDLVSNVDTFESKYAQQAKELGVSPVALGVVTECHYGEGKDVKQDVNNFLVTHESMAETGKNEQIDARMMDNAWLAHYLYSQSNEGQAFEGSTSNIKDTLTKLSEHGLVETSKLTKDQAYAAKEFASDLQAPELGMRPGDPAIGMPGQAGLAGHAGVGGQAGMPEQARGEQPREPAGINRKPLPGTGEKTLVEEQTEAGKTSSSAEEKHEERVKLAENLFDNVKESLKDVGFTFGK
jgi:hypothetical protein